MKLPSSVIPESVFAWIVTMAVFYVVGCVVSCIYAPWWVSLLLAAPLIYACWLAIVGAYFTRKLARERQQAAKEAK